jgi:cytochrome c-type protein NapC
MKRTIGVPLLMVGMMAALPALAGPDWGSVPAKEVPAFFPGPSGLQWILERSDHSAANQILEKNRGCVYCHDEDAPDIGALMVAGKPVGQGKVVLETAPPKGKRPAMPVTVQAAHDGQKLYLRFEWEAASGAVDKKADPKNEVKLAVMFDDNKVEGARLNGCWSTCHMDLRTMPDAADGARQHPKAKALGWGEGVTKYIKESRSALEPRSKPRGGWDKLRSDAELEAALKEGKFMDLIQFRSGKGEKPVDGYVLESRHMDGGTSLTKAEGGRQGNKWVVTFERNLAGAGRGDHTLAAGKLYNVGFAIHENHANARFHHVSLGYSLGLDNPKADFNAVKQ